MNSLPTLNRTFLEARLCYRCHKYIFDIAKSAIAQSRTPCLRSCFFAQWKCKNAKRKASFERFSMLFLHPFRANWIMAVLRSKLNESSLKRVEWIHDSSYVRYNLVREDARKMSWSVYKIKSMMKTRCFKDLLPGQCRKRFCMLVA